MKETDLYEPVSSWLQERGYTVYPEVVCGWGGRRADVVGIKEKESIIVEMKTSLSLELISQGVDWVEGRSANRVYLAVPAPQGSISNYVQILLKREGLGLLLVSRQNGKCSEHWSSKPRLIETDTKNRVYIGNWITDLHKDLDIKGGHSGGGYLTGYRITMMKVREVMENIFQGDWCTVPQILEHAETHYINPRQSLPKALLEFESEWCISKLEGRRRYFKVRGEKK